MFAKRILYGAILPPPEESFVTLCGKLPQFCETST